MSDTFSFKRFGDYFAYDGRHHLVSFGKALIVCGLVPLICYIMFVLFSYVFVGEFSSPNIWVRLFLFCIASGIFFCVSPSKFYGFITDSKEGSAFSMLPVSGLEKFLSMELYSLIIIPLAFFALFFTTDALICLFDSGCGQSLIASASEGCNELVKLLMEDNFSQEMLDYGLTQGNVVLFFVFCVILEFLVSIQFFLLCGVYFKKHKVLYALIVSFLIQTLLSSILVIFLGSVETMEQTISALEDNLGTVVKWIMILTVLYEIASLALLSVLTYLRIKKIKY